MAFRMDPEMVHEMGMNWIVKLGNPLRRKVLEKDPIELFGVRFPNRIGLAAGFDKNALALHRWHEFGFGFAEIGTLTAHSQPGNEKPRLFRLPEDGGIINRMGFNNDGSEVVSQRLRAANAKIPIGVNLGKSKVTPLEEAPVDYQRSFQLTKDLGAYFVINVSSPNTPGLRALQDKGPLVEIIRAIREVDSSKPLFVKMAPDLETDALDELVQVAVDEKLTGLIATNTTISRPDGIQNIHQIGGLSGRPLRARSDEVLAHIRRSVGPKMVLIGVGGVFTRDDYLRKRELGADLVQLYTGWVYGGPMLVPRLLA